MWNIKIGAKTISSASIVLHSLFRAIGFVLLLIFSSLMSIYKIGFRNLQIHILYEILKDVKQISFHFSLMSPEKSRIDTSHHKSFEKNISPEQVALKANELYQTVLQGGTNKTEFDAQDLATAEMIKDEKTNTMKYKENKDRKEVVTNIANMLKDFGKGEIDENAPPEVKAAFEKYKELQEKTRALSQDARERNKNGIKSVIEILSRNDEQGNPQSWKQKFQEYKKLGGWAQIVPDLADGSAIQLQIQKAGLGDSLGSFGIDGRIGIRSLNGLKQLQQLEKQKGDKGDKEFLAWADLVELSKIPNLPPDVLEWDNPIKAIQAIAYVETPKIQKPEFTPQDAIALGTDGLRSIESLKQQAELALVHDLSTIEHRLKDQITGLYMQAMNPQAFGESASKPFAAPVGMATLNTLTATTATTTVAVAAFAGVNFPAIAAAIGTGVAAPWLAIPIGIAAGITAIDKATDKARENPVQFSFDPAIGYSFEFDGRSKRLGAPIAVAAEGIINFFGDALEAAGVKDLDRSMKKQSEEHDSKRYSEMALAKETYTFVKTDKAHQMTVAMVERVQKYCADMHKLMGGDVSRSKDELVSNDWKNDPNASAQVEQVVVAYLTSAPADEKTAQVMTTILAHAEKSGVPPSPNTMMAMAKTFEGVPAPQGSALAALQVRIQENNTTANAAKNSKQDPIYK
jgi:hypothetical protein